MSAQVTNELELRVCGIQRSGNHAIIMWIIEQFRGRPVCFLNNTKHGDYDPYLLAPQRQAYGMDGVPEAQWREAHKALLVYSYEDDAKRLKPGATSLIESAFSPEFESCREKYLGASARRMDVIIIRDPANNFASRLKMLERLTGIKDIPRIVAFWKELVRAALAAEARNDPHVLVVNYNRWFSDKAYRQELSRRLGGIFSDASLRQVSAIGGGSSFDKTALNADITLRSAITKWRKIFQLKTYPLIPSYIKRIRGARDMKVMDRWKEFEQDPRLAQVLADPEVQQLSRQLFGDLPLNAGARRAG